MEEDSQKAKKSEKVTINLGLMELAQIDLLTDNMLYANRSDFIRIAVKKQLESHKEDLERLYQQQKSSAASSDLRMFFGIGVLVLTLADLQNIKAEGKKYKLFVLGMLVIDHAITAKLADETIYSIKLYGGLQALPEIKAVLNNKMLL